MKKLVLTVAALLLSATVRAAATATPANVAVGVFNIQQSTAILSWDNDTSATQWFISFGGVVKYSPARSEVLVDGSNRVNYTMANIQAASLPATITVVASKPGSPLSSPSTGVVLTSVVPVPAAYVVVTNTVQTVSSGTSTVSVTGTVNTNTKVQQPATGLTSITLAATTDWDYETLTCPGQPCNILVYNQSSATLLWWVDNSTDDPAFAGISFTAGSLPIILDIIPGSVFHYRYDQAGGNGFLQNRW